jgi:ATP-dependent Zn protease
MPKEIEFFRAERARTDKPESGKPTRHRAEPARQLLVTAYHEAGHAFADRYFHFKIKQVTIVPDEESLGTARTKYFQFRRLGYGKLSGAQIGRYHDRIVTLLAGEEAQRRFDPHTIRAHQAEGDLCAVRELLFRLHPDQENEASHAFKYLQARTRNLINDPITWRRIQDLAKALLERKTLTGEEVNDVLVASMQAQMEEGRSK